MERKMYNTFSNTFFFGEWFFMEKKVNMAVTIWLYLSIYLSLWRYSYLYEKENEKYIFSIYLFSLEMFSVITIFREILVWWSFILLFLPSQNNYN